MAERMVLMIVGCRAGRMEVRTAAKTIQSMAVNWDVLERAGVRTVHMMAPAAVKSGG